MQRILIVKMWALGDILMATPLLRALKRQYPDCSISWLVEKDQAGILKGNPFIDDVIDFDSGTWRRQFRYGQFVSYLRTSTELRKSLKNKQFDAVINLTAEKWWSVWFTVAPIRIGLFPTLNIGWIKRVYTTTIPRTKEPWLHNTQHYLLPAQALNIPGPYEEQMVVGVSDADRARVDDILAASKDYDPSKPLLILHPGTSQASKCWPTDSYAKVATAFGGQYNIAITGNNKEIVLAEEIVRAVPDGSPKPIIASGLFDTIIGTAALVAKASAVVTGDTSILHVSSALDVPLVGIFGSTRPRDNAPLFGRSKLLFVDDLACSPCYKSKCPLKGAQYMTCMHGVSPESVITAVRELVAQPAAAG
jgi:heptosyltransferase-1